MPTSVLTQLEAIMFFPPPFGLVVYTLNNGHGYHGVICRTEEDSVLIYDFIRGETCNVKKGQYLPFTADNYQTMCNNKWWPGLLVKSFNQKVHQVTAGQKDMFGFTFEITSPTFFPGMNHQFWLPLHWFIPCGHINDGVH